MGGKERHRFQMPRPICSGLAILGLGGNLRTVHTLILRLLVNSSEPEVLRGDVRLLPEGEPLPFADEQKLLILLHGIVGRQPEPPDNSLGNATC